MRALIFAALLLVPAAAQARGPQSPDDALRLIRGGKVADGLRAYKKGCTGRLRHSFRNNARALPVIAGQIKKGKSTDVRIQAIEMMTYFKQPAALAAVAGGLGDADQSVRTQAATTLGHIGSAEAGAHLVTFLRKHAKACAEKSGASDDDCVYGLHGLSLTEKYRTKNRAETLELIKTVHLAPSPKVRELAMHALDEMQDAKGLPLVQAVIAKEKMGRDAGGFAQKVDAGVLARFKKTAARLSKAK